jgi:hypothetical protein
VPIPSDRMQSPEVVWAAPDDTLEQIRDRLESPGIEKKWQACVLVQHQDMRHAVTSVSEIRSVVWEEGPPALKRTVQDLGLLHFQPGVEQEAVDWHEAEQLADAHGGRLVVLQSGRYVGLVQSRGTSTAVKLQPSDAFDLFDGLLPDSALARIEFVEASLDTTLARVARELKSKHDPKSSYVIVKMYDGSYGVIASRELNERVQDADGDLWGMPLREFASHLQRSQPPVRKRTMVGHRQAQQLADTNGFLILTEQAKPVGLLVSQVVWRAASLPQSLSFHGSVYDLFTVPQELLDFYIPRIGPERDARFVNVWFEGLDQQLVDRKQPLLADNPYTLALNVGRLRETSIVDWDHTPAGPEAIVEPQEEACLYVSLFSQDFAIPEPTQSFRLPKQGDTEPVRFKVVPLRRRQGAGLATLEACLYFRTYLVQTFEVLVEVVAAGETADTAQPQVARLAHARTTSFPDMEKLPPRELSLTITRDGTDRYRFTFLVDAEPDDEAGVTRAMELSCLVRLTRDDLTHLITKARRQLYNVVQAFDLLGERGIGMYHKATRALAQVGRQLYLKLFESSSAQALKAWMETGLPDGSTIQIVDLAGDFVFPWSLVYTAQPWDDEEPIDVRRFWGWRYKLVTLTQTLLDTYRQAQTEIATAEPLRMSVGMYERLVGAAEQKAFFADLRASTGQRILPEILTDRRDMAKALADADRDLYYFFCHGYTERIATDIQLDADLLSYFAQLTAGTRDTTLREHLDDLFDVSDSWMRFTQGKILLAMLKEAVPGPFSRYPVVFLNMCESAQVLPSLSDGFVPFFIQRGARAVFGTECSMNTAFADDFARAFLTRFFQGEAAGEILLALRRHYLDEGNPLALAYTLYCDADLRLSGPLLPVDQAADNEETEVTSAEEARWEAVQLLWKDDIDGLLLTLAARAQAGEEGVAQDALQMWAPPPAAFATDLEASSEYTEKMIALGQKWWDKFEPEVYDVVCNKRSAEHHELVYALLEGAKVLAVTLAPALVAQISVLPAVAIVLATIVAKQAAESGLEVACELWAESMAGRNGQRDEQDHDGLEEQTEIPNDRAL